MPEVIEKLAGHAPAVKVGGMRISQGRSTSFSEASPSKSNKSDDLDIEEKIENKNVQPTLISGTPVKIEDAYPAEAVRRFHEKPIPTHDPLQHYKPSRTTGAAGIFQPRKQ